MVYQADKDYLDLSVLARSRGVSLPSNLRRSAISAQTVRRSYSDEEVRRLEEFTGKIVCGGQQALTSRLRKIFSQLEEHETVNSSAFRPMRFSNSLPASAQLVESWRETQERKLPFAAMLLDAVTDEIALQAPHVSQKDWPFLRESWLIAGGMGIPNIAKSALNQFSSFDRLQKLPEEEMKKLLHNMLGAANMQPTGLQ